MASVSVTPERAIGWTSRFDSLPVAGGPAVALTPERRLPHGHGHHGLPAGAQRASSTTFSAPNPNPRHRTKTTTASCVSPLSPAYKRTQLGSPTRAPTYGDSGDATMRGWACARARVDPLCSLPLAPEAVESHRPIDR
ncbi:hypothetical protein GUJ93_ZPchr0010g9133 [Zizania palustris]|uniref:Uncharacterized protein n=1 Tax=Zizania palustris TaxID=103762 RepID=A0A8J6BI65_ZIZPA|nr:hypothetical protein GUJ93_ZPchr0010g9133 [Zizania palustris]